MPTTRVQVPWTDQLDESGSAASVGDGADIAKSPTDGMAVSIGMGVQYEDYVGPWLRISF